MKTTHTPGPWGTIHSGKTVVGPPTGRAEHPIPQSPGFREVIACSIENPANARLIASAPELLDALTDAYRELVADDIVTQVLREKHHLPHTENPVLEKIRAAIARATQP